MGKFKIGSTEIFIALALTAALIAFLLMSCKKDPVDQPPSDPYCYCSNATVVVSSAPKFAFTRLDSGAYGANNYFIYELDSTAQGYVYKTSGNVVERKLAKENWTIPTGFIWSAGRSGTDGNDPYVPSIGDEFIYPYLPWSPGIASWSSITGTVNDKTSCPDLNNNNYWAPLCSGLDGKHQLDHLAPQLQNGKFYLIRMVMGYSVNGKFNIVSSCYQKAFKFETGVY
jgi:hypothetical protein